MIASARMTVTNNAAKGQRRVLVVEDDSLVGMGLESNLEKLGHQVVGRASNAKQAMEIFLREQPDFILMDIRLDGDDGIAVAAQFFGHRRCPMIIISAYSDKDLIERAIAAGVYGYLIKPVSLESLRAQMEVAARRFEEQEQLLQEKQGLERTLESRKLIERAKGILMKRMNLSEPDAHRRLQQESQKRRLGLPELAKRVIESEELLGG